jgi:putative tricarboxylic transport membrane protein
MENSEREERVLVWRSVAEYLCALVFLIAGAVMMWDSYKVGAGWGDMGPKSGYFPFRIGIIVCVAALAVMVETWRNKSASSESFVTRAELKPVLQVFVPILLFVVLMELLGMYIAAFALITGFMRGLGKYGWLRSALVAVCVSGAMFWLFEIQFMVPLIKGPLEAAFGY